MKNTTNKRVITMAICLILLSAMLFNLASCAIEAKAANLMEGIDANVVAGKQIDEKFIDNTADFSIELFKRSLKENENALISPLSVILALSMTANGADNETLAQMEQVLGGDITIDQLNEYLYTYSNSLPSKDKSKFSIANSIWFRDDEERLQVVPDFLQKNVDYYNAAAYKSAFDDQTLADINNWVKNNTDGMIDKILDQISDDAVMYLINAIVFDAEWETIYREDQVAKRDFTNMDGTTVNIDMMNSEETKFLKDRSATGFIKPYANDDYSFVALLPNEDISVYDYISSLTGETFLDIITNAQSTGVNATMPKFSYDYTYKMNEALIDMGMPNAFHSEAADFTKMATSSRGNIFIFEVLHKTFISVDERGTKAGAVTKVEMQDECAFMGETVILNRPFVYAIIDNATNLPIFIGTVTNLK
ncbi:MAG: serine protease [Clostridiales bacterium GWF2_38_85]|nr:MAG: serine protease [Clostridiales bacterium GWF2_38_85]HBL83959.1 serine protease [Clostridiales bacterium]